MRFSAQTTCNQGIGRIVYERLPDQQLQGFDDDVVSVALLFLHIHFCFRTHSSSILSSLYSSGINFQT